MLPASVAGTLYWTIQSLRGRGSLREKLAVLEETQWLSPRQTLEYSFRKLEKLLHYAYDNVPYYRSLMQRHGFNVQKFTTFEDLKKLPELSRTDLETNFKELQSANIARYHAHESCSSGSTGQPARFMQDEAYDVWCRAHQIRAYGWCGNWRQGERFALVWGSPVYWDKQTVVRKIEAAFTNRIELNCNNIGTGTLEYILRRLQEFNPVLISGYSTALYLLAELAKEKGVHLEALRALQPNAEPTYDYMASAMAEHFKVPVYDKYGSTETNIVAHQTTGNKDHMYIQSENAHVEFLAENGDSCRSGEEGRLVITTLNNYSMPLIRYQTSDIAAPLEGQCSSGRGFPLMSKVRGRLYDCIRTATGQKVHPQVFSNLFSNFTQVRWFQVVQNQLDTLEVSLLVRDADARGLEGTFTKMINLRTGGHFRVTYNYLGVMPSTTTGKYKICICNLKD